MIKNTDKITNRHVAKLMSRLNVLELPEIAKNEIIRQMHFLKKDLISEIKLRGEDNGLDKSSNR